MSVLARAVREVEPALQKGRATSTTRAKFHAIALVLRDERARVRAEETGGGANQAEPLKRLDGIATIRAKTAVRDSELMALLAEDAVVSDEARSVKREMLRAAGMEAAPEPRPAVERPDAAARGVVPQSVVSRQLANPFLAPDRSAARPSAPRATRLATWELIGPLLNSFERAGAGAPAGMALPAPSSRRA